MHARRCGNRLEGRERQEVGAHAAAQKTFPVLGECFSRPPELRRSGRPTPDATRHCTEEARPRTPLPRPGGAAEPCVTGTDVPEQRSEFHQTFII